MYSVTSQCVCVVSQRTSIPCGHTLSSCCTRIRQNLHNGNTNIISRKRVWSMLYMRVGKLKGMTVIDENDEIFQILLQKYGPLKASPNTALCAWKLFQPTFVRKTLAGEFSFEIPIPLCGRFVHTFDFLVQRKAWHSRPFVSAFRDM